jgi:recombination protein RecA
MVNLSRLRKLQELKNVANKANGRGTVRLSNRVIKIPRLDSGSLAMNFALGGGFPIGRTTLVWGDESSGKTTTILRTAGIAQDRCANCLRPVADIEVEEVEDMETGEIDFAAKAQCDCYKEELFLPVQYPGELKDAYGERLERYQDNSYEEYRVAIVNPEGDHDAEWAEKLGLDERRVVLATPDTGEQAIDTYIELLSTGSVDLIVMDSIAAMVPSTELTESTEKWQQGLQARLVNKWNRSAQGAVTGVAKDFGRTPTQIWTNQVRQKIGVMFGSNEVMPAGNGQKFSASIILRMRSASIKKDDKDDFERSVKEINKQQVAKRGRFNFTVEKNKTGPSKINGGFWMRLIGKYSGTIEEGEYILDMAKQFNIIEKQKGNSWRFGSDTFSSLKAVKEKMQEPGVKEELKSGLLERMLARRDADESTEK